MGGMAKGKTAGFTWTVNGRLGYLLVHFFRRWCLDVMTNAGCCKRISAFGIYNPRFVALGEYACLFFFMF